MKPSASCVATSPVRSQPSSNAARVASSLCEDLGPADEEFAGLRRDADLGIGHRKANASGATVFIEGIAGDDGCGLGEPVAFDENAAGEFFPFGDGRGGQRGGAGDGLLNAVCLRRCAHDALVDGRHGGHPRGWVCR